MSSGPYGPILYFLGGKKRRYFYQGKYSIYICENVVGKSFGCWSVLIDSSGQGTFRQKLWQKNGLKDKIESNDKRRNFVEILKYHIPYCINRPFKIKWREKLMINPTLNLPSYDTVC